MRRREQRARSQTPNPATTIIGVKVVGPNWRDRTAQRRFTTGPPALAALRGCWVLNLQPVL
jgi:hypothetical protein